MRSSFLCIVTGRERVTHTHTFRHAFNALEQTKLFVFPPIPVLFFLFLCSFSLFLLHYEKLDLAATCHTE